MIHLWPLIGLVLSISLLPLAAPHFWHHHYGKVAAAWSVVGLFAMTRLTDVSNAIHLILGALLLDIAPLCIMVASLWIVAGGIALGRKAAPATSTRVAMLVAGFMLAGLIGSLAATAILFRSFLASLPKGQYHTHSVVFFLVIVGNLGGGLSPWGNPVLYSGLRHGLDVNFFASQIWPIILPMFALFIVSYYVFDTVVSMTSSGDTEDSSPRERPAHLASSLLNAILLSVMVSALLFNSEIAAALAGTSRAEIDVGGIGVNTALAIRDGILVSCALVSLLLTPRAAHADNGFVLGPAKENVILYTALFVCLVPAMWAANQADFEILQEARRQNSFLFLVTLLLVPFFEALAIFQYLGAALGGISTLSTAAPPGALTALCLGVIFGGAFSWIGNAPNFMIKAMAEQQGWRMPSFFGYLLWTSAIILPAAIWYFIIAAPAPLR